MTNEQLLAIWGMNGRYYNDIMNSCPYGLDANEWHDFLFSQIGL